MRLAPRLFAIVLISACGPSVGFDGEGDGDSGGDQGPGGPFEPYPENCGAQTEAIPARNVGDPPDLLVVMDRSVTMDAPIDPFNPNGPDRLSAMGDALAAVAADYDENIHFGLSVFPTAAQCDVAPGTAVPIAPRNAGALIDYFSGLEAGGGTPAHLALENAAAVYAGRAANPAGRYVLFATDGVPGCGGNQDPAALTIAAIRDLAAAGVQTFVLAFGGVELPTEFLDEAALAGGVPRASGSPYYQVGGADDLDAALSEIAGGAFVPSCSYALDSTPPDPELVTVTIDGVTVPRDPAREGGWDYAPDDSTITFFGAACDLIEDGGARNVSFVYGCPGPVVD